MSKKEIIKEAIFFFFVFLFCLPALPIIIIFGPLMWLEICKKHKKEEEEQQNNATTSKASSSGKLLLKVLVVVMAIAVIAFVAVPNMIDDGPTKATAERMVYITNTGEKYHEYGCRYLSQSCIKISYKKAISRGYDACSICH